MGIHRNTVEGSSPPKRVIISRLSAHGDVLQTLPLLVALKQADPSLFVGWVVEEAAAPLLVNHPLIDRLHISRRKHWLKTLNRQPWQLFGIMSELKAFVNDIKACQYEASFDVQGLLKSAVWPWLANIPRRYGYKDTRESAAWLYNCKIATHDMHDAVTPTWLVFMRFAQASGIVETLPNVETLQELAIPTAPINENHQNAVKTLLASLPSPHQPLVVVAPHTQWPSKHWSQSSWQSLLSQLEQLPVNVVLVGAPNEVDKSNALLATLPNSANRLDLTGQTNWPELTALLAEASVVIGPDSAPLHMGNIIASQNQHQKPRLIALFGPTAPGRTGPLHPNHYSLTAGVDCQPCFKRLCPYQGTHREMACMQELSPAVVFDHIRDILDHLPVAASQEAKP